MRIALTFILFISSSVLAQNTILITGFTQERLLITDIKDNKFKRFKKSYFTLPIKAKTENGIEFTFLYKDKEYAISALLVTTNIKKNINPVGDICNIAILDNTKGNASTRGLGENCKEYKSE